MKRYGQIIKLKPEYEEKYKTLHADPWPQVNEMIKKCNIQNYSIFLKNGFLFAYMEYVGTDFEKDMERMAEDPMTQKWWKETDPCQEPIEGALPAEKWVNMEEVYHLG